MNHFQFFYPAFLCVTGIDILYALFKVLFQKTVHAVFLQGLGMALYIHYPTYCPGKCSRTLGILPCLQPMRIQRMRNGVKPVLSSCPKGRHERQGHAGRCCCIKAKLRVPHPVY